MERIQIKPLSVNGCWSKEDLNFLKNNYPDKGKDFCINKLNRTEASVRYMASKLKLRLNTSSEFFKEFQERAAKSKIGKKRPQHSIVMKAHCKNGDMPHLTKKMSNDEKNKISLAAKERIRKNGHPKGFKGHTHSKETRKKLSEISKKMWGDENHKVNSEEYRQMLSDRASNAKRKMSDNAYSRSKKGTVLIGDKTYFVRSEWEYNIGCYLEFLKKNKEIKEWEYEVDTFWFNEIKRGVRSYKPDFKITRNDGSFYYIEVKGWMDGKSKTKLKRMKKYYPEIKVELLMNDRYKAIQKNSKVIPGWGKMTNYILPEKPKCKIDGCDEKIHSKKLCRKHFYIKYKK